MLFLVVTRSINAPRVKETACARGRSWPPSCLPSALPGGSCLGFSLLWVLGRTRASAVPPVLLLGLGSHCGQEPLGPGTWAARAVTEAVANTPGSRRPQPRTLTLAEAKDKVSAGNRPAASHRETWPECLAPLPPPGGRWSSGTGSRSQRPSRDIRNIWRLAGLQNRAGAARSSGRGQERLGHKTVLNSGSHGPGSP